MVQWNTPRPGHGMGIAFSDYHGSFSAGVAEVSVNCGTDKIKVHNYWVAVDPGIIVQPVNVHAQAESAVVYGLSAALLEELTFKDGTVEQRNFNDYPVLRIADLPEIHTRIVASGAEPSGMDEIGVPCVAPAIGNAVFQLTGKRIRALPMSPQRVKKLLA
jgi:isoquinoline 1-oxidoreductase beta subunit